MCGLHRETSTHVGKCDAVRIVFTRINKFKCLGEDFLFPTDDSNRTRQAKRSLFVCPGEGAPKSIINFMIILWENILISFYKVDIDNTPFNADAIWRYTLKRFADLALAQAHEARTTHNSSPLAAGKTPHPSPDTTLRTTRPPRHTRCGG
jgi:hypothetical protein